MQGVSPGSASGSTMWSKDSSLAGLPPELHTESLWGSAGGKLRLRRGPYCSSLLYPHYEASGFPHGQQLDPNTQWLLQHPCSSTADVSRPGGEASEM